MRFAEYARLNGACSSLIGVLFVVSGFPGLFAGSRDPWLVFPAVAIVLLPIGLFARRRGTPLREPGRWLTDRALGAAVAGQSVLPRAALRRRLIVETVIWAAIAVAVIAGFSTSRPFAYATGWASLAYGLLELLGSARRIEQVEAEQGRHFLVHRRPGLGTPDVTTN